MTVKCFFCGKRVDDGNFKSFYRNGEPFVTGKVYGNRVITTFEEFDCMPQDAFSHCTNGIFHYSVVCKRCSYKIDNFILRT